MIADRDDLPDDVDQNPVDVLAGEFSERLRNGENPSITEYVRRRPDLEQDIRELFPTITMMEQFRRKQQADTQLSQVTARLDAERLKQIGDFRILREVGRGGMGVVYAAEQQSLKRPVALKVLAPSVTGSENELRRFKREAEAAARLHHTNIVPVFGTGEDDGFHFIVMQLVDGVPLNEAISSVRGGSRSTVRPENTSTTDEGSSENQDSSSDSFTAAMAASALLTGTTLQPTAASIAAKLKAASTAESFEVELTTSPTPTKSFHGSQDGVSDDSDLNALDPESEVLHKRLDRDLGRKYWSSVAGIAAEIADALSYAHDQGVVHRDVKPSNILFDRSGGVWITDFGLARHEEQEAVTRSGDIVGTLRYMAPEQCNGTGDARSDIYSLGLTLFELLALQPAFPDSRHGVLIQKKQDGAFPRPRSLNSRIPRDLETITLKACATDPAHRYQHASEVAEDLRRFLDDRPVRARQATSAERVIRWARRNPIVAGLSATSFTLLVAVAVVFAVGNYRTGVALSDARKARATAEGEKTLAQIERNRAIDAAQKAKAEEQRAKEESERAEANLQTAIAAFNQIIENIASRGVPQSMNLPDSEAGEAGPVETLATSNDSVVTQADAELLETLLHFFDEFASRNSADLELQSAVARRIIGDIHQRLGRLDDAESAYREALAIVESLSESDPEDGLLTLQHARILNDLGVTLSRRGQYREPFELHLRARRMISESDDLMASTDGRFALAQTHNLMGSIGSRTGYTQLLAALSSDGNLRPRRPSMDRRPRRNEDQNQGGSRENSTQSRSESSTQGSRSRNQRQRSVSTVSRILESYEQAVELLTGLIEQNPSSGEFRLALARCFRNRMQFAGMIGHRELEADSLIEAIESLSALTADYPQVPVYQFELADTLCLNPARPPGERDAEYEFRVRQAVSICRNLITAYPTFAEYRALMATSLSRLAAIHRAGGEINSARLSWLEALDIQRELTAEYKDVSSYHLLYVHTLTQLASLEDTDGTAENAREFRSRAAEHLQRMLDGGENRLYRRLLEELERRLDDQSEDRRDPSE